MTQRRANIFGLGLIGGSLGLALSSKGWHVTGCDSVAQTEQQALSLGVIQQIGVDKNASITFVATPVSTIGDQVARALRETSGLVTDVGGVKAHLADQIHDPRFIGGHPMAGSELIGLTGADPKLFEGAVWVLTPSVGIDDKNFEKVAAVVTELGSEIVVLDPHLHDQLVAIVSHLPHLTAAALMGLASERAQEHVAVLRLAAGGFRDMTRVASGHPAIWIDICRENRDAIVIALDGLIDGLAQMKQIVVQGDSNELTKRLQQSRVARSNLPSRVRDLMDVVEVRVPIPDRSGAAAEIFTLAAELGVNIANFEVAHSVEGDRGVLVLVVEQISQDVFRGGLIARGFRPTLQQIS